MEIELSIIMPCLNEAETLELCIQKAQKFLEKNNIHGEIIIADNGSTDGSQEIARKLRTRLVNISLKGYGAALMGGISAANGKLIIMGDADNSYDFSNIYPFIVSLRNGSDLVIGNRFKGGIKKGSMPFLHRYLGNPVLSFLGRIFFKIKIGDFHCGLRAFKKESIHKLNLQTKGMEFASEMIVKASLNNLIISEVDTILYKDGRLRKPHLRTWQDGWRHLRFLVLYSPKWLFLYPSVMMILFGIILSTTIIINPIEIGEIKIDVHTLLYASGLTTIGFQFFLFYALTKIYAVETGLLPKSNRYENLFKYINLEKGLLIGFLLLVIGIFLSAFGFSKWVTNDFGNLDPSEVLRIIIPAVFTLILGFQIIVFSFFFSILGLKS